MIRLQELSFSHFKRFVQCFDPVKMSKFIGFLFDPFNMEGDLKKLWTSILDIQFVNEAIIFNLKNHLEQARELLAELIEKAAKGMTLKKSSKPPTQPNPFTLTIPKPRKLPEPSFVIPTFTKVILIK